jgi:putative transposase
MEPGHRKRIQHFEQVRHLHELTFSCYQRRPLLTNDNSRSLLASSLQSACEEERFDLIAFVFMPEHVHLMVMPQTGTSKVSRLLARTKQPVSRQIRELLEHCRSPWLDELTVQERPGKRCFRFWQEGAGFDRNLFSPAAIEAVIDDIHMNPVNRGLCQTATDFKSSSARFQLQGNFDADLPRLTRIDPDWLHHRGCQPEQT